MDFRFFGKCYGCKHKRFFICKRTVPTPVGNAKSREMFCKQCFIKLMTKLNHEKK